VGPLAHCHEVPASDSVALHDSGRDDPHDGVRRRSPTRTSRKIAREDTTACTGSGTQKKERRKNAEGKPNGDKAKVARWVAAGPHTRSKGGTLSIAREGKPYGASIALLPTCTTPPVCHNHSVRHPSIPQRLLDALVAQWTHGTPSGPGAGAAAGRWYDGSPAACRSAPRPHRTHMPAAGGRKQSPRVRPHAVWSVSV
jgi:hypothetical protein